jgi:hypothetical protein
MIIGWSDRHILHRHSLAIARFSWPPWTFAWSNFLLLTLAHTIPGFRALDAQRELARGVCHIRLDLEYGSDANEGWECCSIENGQLYRDARRGALTHDVALIVRREELGRISLPETDIRYVFQSAHKNR